MIPIPGFSLPSAERSPLARERFWAERLAHAADLPTWRVQLAMHRRSYTRIPSLRSAAADAASLHAALLECHEAGMSLEEVWARPCEPWTSARLTRSWRRLRARLGHPHTLRAELLAGGLARCASTVLALAAARVLPPLHDEDELCYDGNWPEGKRRRCMPAPPGMQSGDTTWVQLDSGVHVEVEICTDEQYWHKVHAWPDPADHSPIGTRLTGAYAELRASDAWGEEYSAWSEAFPELLLERRGIIGREPLHARSRALHQTLTPRERWALRLLHLRGFFQLLADDLRLVALEHRDARSGRHTGMFHRHRVLRPLAPRLTRRARQLHRDITERRSSPDGLTAAERQHRTAALAAQAAPLSSSSTLTSQEPS